MFASFLTLLVSLVGANVSAAKHDKITGKITDHRGEPVADAYVLVHGSQPKSAASGTQSYNDPGIGRLVLSDDAGLFEIDSLDPENKYQLAISANGYQGLISKYMEVDGQPVPLTLISTAIGDAGGNSVKGRVVDSSGKPVAGATLQVSFLQMGNRGTGSDPSVPSLTITNPTGAFDFQVGKHITHISFRAQANGFAPSPHNWKPEDKKPLEIPLDKGGAISGQLVYRGQPVKARLGMVQKDRFVPNLVTPREVDTDDEGNFRIEQLPPSRDYALYTTIDRANHAALPVSLLQVPGNGKLADFGQIELQEADSFKVSIMSSDGKPLPEGGTVYIGRALAWHTLVLKVPGGAPIATVAASAVADEEIKINLRLANAKVVEVRPTMPQGQNDEYTFSTEQTRQVTFVVTSQ